MRPLPDSQDKFRQSKYNYIKFKLVIPKAILICLLIAGMDICGQNYFFLFKFRQSHTVEKEKKKTKKKKKNVGKYT